MINAENKKVDQNQENGVVGLGEANAAEHQRVIFQIKENREAAGHSAASAALQAQRAHDEANRASQSTIEAALQAQRAHEEAQRAENIVNEFFKAMEEMVNSLRKERSHLSGK